MCIFCKIVKRDVPASIVYEDEDILAFKDANPLAPVHVLIIPKKHVESVNDFEAKDIQLAGKMILTAKKIAADFDLSPKGYKLLIRVGEWGGQEVQHVHLHLLGGAKLQENIHPLI